jgi:hypothetical protein
MKKSLRYTKNALRGAVIAGTVYFFSLVLGEAYNNILSKPIRDQMDLESKLIQERKKLGYKIKENEVIRARKAHDKELTQVKKNIIGYEIILSENYFTEAGLKHELYHIADGHLEKRTDGFLAKARYFFWNEPQAAIYQITGLKP